MRLALVCALVLGFATAPGDSAGQPADLTPIEQDMVRHLDSLQPELIAVNQDIWTYAEISLQEHRSAARLTGVLKKTGFRVIRGSTDVGDISWNVPTGGLRVACRPIGSPGHSWQFVASSGSPIAHKGLMVAAKVLALSIVDLLQNPQAVQDAKADFAQRMKQRSYETRIPKGQKAPKAIR